MTDPRLDSPAMPPPMAPVLVVLAAATGATYLRIDTIEADLRRRGETFAGPRGDLGYTIAYALARDALSLGTSVIVDGVHGWPGAATLRDDALAGTGSALLRVLLICTAPQTHRARVETRRAETPNAGLPDWSDVQNRAFAPDPAPELTLDTATLTPQAAVALIRARMDGRDTV